jgi:RNA polymerase primary sigma factor
MQKVTRIDGILKRTNLTDIYLKEVNNTSILTKEEEILLFKKYKEKNDQKAFEKILKSNLRFVILVAKNYQHSWYSLDDLISSGNEGLIIAAQKFDYTKGNRFTSYAVWWIRSKILTFLSEHRNFISYPVNKIQEDIKNFKKIRSVEEEDYVPLVHQVYSLDKCLSHDSENTFMDILVNENADEVIDDRIDDSLVNSLAYLNPRERDVISFIFGLRNKTPMSIPEIAEYYGVSRPTIDNIHKRALRKLKFHIKKERNKLDKMRSFKQEKYDPRKLAESMSQIIF